VNESALAPNVATSAAAMNATSACVSSMGRGYSLMTRGHSPG
jgi:hypothetical protein